MKEQLEAIAVLVGDLITKETNKGDESNVKLIEDLFEIQESIEKLENATEAVTDEA